MLYIVVGTDSIDSFYISLLFLQYLIQARLASIADQWEFLTQKTTEKSLKLKEANKQRTYIAAVKDLDFWLGEVNY